MIYTFYSYKGGVGRSMAMAGVAYLLAERGLRVLVVDFDLEAPGLERYFFEQDEARRVRGCPGIIDLILQYKRALSNKQEFEKREFRNWRAFVTEGVPSTAEGGCVDIMPAGRREPDENLRAYARAVRGFDWQDFFDNWNGAKFFDWLRGELTDPSRGYDVVLVDSRTGVTEMGGVCAYQLADVAIMLCAANYQNLDGTLSVLRDFRSDSVLALRGGRPLELLVVAARLESTHPGREGFIEEFERAFASDGLPKVLADAGLSYRELALPYDARYAVAERIVGEETATVGKPSPGLDLVGDFGKLADALTLLAQGGRLADQQPLALARLRGEAPQHQAIPVADVTKRGAGFDAIIDVAPADRLVAARLMEELSAKGLSIAIVDQSSSEADPQLEVTLRTLQYSQALIVIVGTQGSSAFRTALIREARKNAKMRIIPVLLSTSIPPNVLASYGLEEFQRLVVKNPQDLESGDGIERIAEILRPRPTSIVHAAPARDPYPGARAFGEDDAPYFYGRENDINRLVEFAQEFHLVALLGASGVGKTSLVRGGLIPNLRHPDSIGASWRIKTFDFSSPTGQLKDVRFTETDPEHQLVILDHIDSFEHDGSDAARERRRKLIRDFQKDQLPKTRVLLCGRNTWIGDVTPDNAWLDDHASRGVIMLEPMSPEQLSAAAQKPAHNQRHLFESGLVDRLLEDCGDSPAAIALLQVALEALWRERRRGWLTNQAYAGFGGIDGLISRAKAEFLRECGPDDHQRVKTFLSNLVSLDIGLKLLPEQRPWNELRSIEALGPDCVALRDRLAAHRLIVIATVGGSRIDCALTAPYADVCVSNAEIDPEFMLWRQRFDTYVLAWKMQGVLVQQPQLAEAERWLATRKSELTGDERAAIEASLGAFAEERRKEAQDRELARASQRATDAEAQIKEARREVGAVATPEDLITRHSKLLERLRGRTSKAVLGEATKLADELRKARDFDRMILLVEAISRHDLRNVKVRRLYAQCLVETGKTTAAIDLLEVALRNVPKAHPEFIEITGLLGRAHKQLYFDAGDRKSPSPRKSLGAAIAAYRQGYERHDDVWLGVNYIALLDVAERVGLDVPGKQQPRNIARKLVAALERRPVSKRDPWLKSCLAEANLGLRDWDGLQRGVRDLVEDPHTQAFHIESTLRQFRQVWNLEQIDARGRDIVELLNSRLLKLPGAVAEVDVREIGKQQQQTRDAPLQALLGPDGNKALGWWRVGLDRASAVASIRNQLGERLGTGFLIHGADLGLAGEKAPVLLTAFYLVNEHGLTSGLKQEEAELAFEGSNDNRTFKVERILWSSPVEQHDVTVLRLDPAPTGIVPLPLARALPVLGTTIGAPRVYIIGHPRGGGLTVSFQDNELIDHEGPPNGKPQIPGVERVHYRAPTEPGSGGSPVFNSSWQVIAIHHKGGKLGMPRLNGVTGTYGANEGIGIQSIAAAIASEVARPPQVR